MVSNITRLCEVRAHGESPAENQSSAFNPLGEQGNKPGANVPEGHQGHTQNHVNLNSGMEDASLTGDNQNRQGEDTGGQEEDAEGQREDTGSAEDAQNPDPLDANGIEATQGADSEHAQLARCFWKG